MTDSVDFDQATIMQDRRATDVGSCACPAVVACVCDGESRVFRD
jgi:hypothetical protein